MSQPFIILPRQKLTVGSSGKNRTEAEENAKEYLKMLYGPQLQIFGVYDSQLVGRSPPRRKQNVPDEEGGFLVELVPDESAPASEWTEEWNFTFNTQNGP